METCTICQKTVRGKNNLRMHMQVHSSGSGQTATAPSQSTHSISQGQTQPSTPSTSMSAIDQMKAHMIAQNEVLMLKSLNKQLRDEINPPAVPSVQVPNQFQEVRAMLKEIKEEILDELSQQGGEEHDPMMSMILPMMMAKMQQGGSNVPSTPSVGNIQDQATEAELKAEVVKALK